MVTSKWWNGLGGVRVALYFVWPLTLAAACIGGRPSLPAFENCAIAGDENENGVADCDDLACRAFPTCAECGNHQREVGEDCDDGNLVDSDGCDSNCRTTGCTNGVVTSGEVCDDGNAIDGDGCDGNCRITGCGNAAVTAGEVCDDGNTMDGDGCDRNCQPTGCGNGVVTNAESCDDGNAVDGDGCDHDCSVTACGNGIATQNEDCDDGNLADGDGCNPSCHFTACADGPPAAHGAGGSFPLAGEISKLIAEPGSCFLYALDTAPSSHLIVISTVTRRPIARIALREHATDLAMSPNSAYLVISYDSSTIGIVDPGTKQVTTRMSTAAAPFSVAVTDRGVAFYGEAGSTVHRIDLRDGRGDGPGLTLLSGPTLTLSRDGHSLYIGEWGISSGLLAKYDVSGGTMVLVDHNTVGFHYPPRHAYVSPGGQHVYYANHQFDSTALATIRGSTGEPIYAEDAAGTFAVGATQVFDAQLVRPVAALPHSASAATLTAGDRALWYHSPDTSRLYYLDPQELIGSVELGVREVPPGPLDEYRFAELIHDPVRPRLYGVDPTHGAVVVIDAGTLQPTRAILVGSGPGDIDIDPAGTTLFVAHDDTTAFAQIRLDSLQLARFVSTARFASRLAAVRGDRLVVLDRAQFNAPLLVDAGTGAVISQAPQVAGGTVATTADGGTVFIGHSNVSPGTMVRYAVVGDRLVETHREFGLEGLQRPVVAAADGSRVFYAGHVLDGRDLRRLPQVFDGPILAISPDGRRAISARSIYDVSTGARLGGLLNSASAVAISPDSATAFVSSEGALRAVSLTAF